MALAKVTGTLTKDNVIIPASDPARDLNNASSYGAILKNGDLQLSLHEALYLHNKKTLTITQGKKTLTTDELIKKALTKDKDFWTKHQIYEDLRSRGYITKTALKFGADFRVYDRGIKPGEDHAKWIVYPVHERNKLTWTEFSAKNRVATSTKKRLLIGIVDDEGDVTYFEVKWLRP